MRRLWRVYTPKYFPQPFHNPTPVHVDDSPKCASHLRAFPRTVPVLARLLRETTSARVSKNKGDIIALLYSYGRGRNGREDARKYLAELGYERLGARQVGRHPNDRLERRHGLIHQLNVTVRWRVHRRLQIVLFNCIIILFKTEKYHKKQKLT